MKIKSLEISGFKSFYDKTRIHFDHELNAIVGPNGCGKSNIIDAIRWILGEQNPRQLRANVMEEIISNGSEFLKPLGMAEVSLVMEKVPTYDFEQVEIKRRVFRSGENEYYLNGVQCRLKDITDIFIDTGSGARAFSIIGQGRVDQLITAKPEDKRTVIEEVAGIRKYKLRRRETETRIKTTRENLSRVKDMTNEVKRQMETLSLQAKQAAEFRELSEEARVLEFRILRARTRKLETRRQKVLAEKATLDRQVSEAEAEIIQAAGVQKALGQRAHESEEALRQLEEAIFRTRTELNQKISSQELIKTEISNIDRFIEKIESETGLMTNERVSLLSQIDAKKAALEEVGEALRLGREDIAASEEKLAGVKAGFAEIRTEHREIRDSLFKTLDEYSSLKGAALGYEKELKELYSKKESIDMEIAEAGEEKEHLLSEISRMGQVLADYEARKAGIREKKEELKAAMGSAREERARHAAENESAREELKENASRLNALNQIEINYEWLPEGIRDFILENKGNGVLGTVSDFISAFEGYERAVESALGEKIKWIVVGGHDEAIRAVDALRERSLGRGTFIPGGPQNGAGHASPLPDCKALSELVELGPDGPESVREMLKSIYLVPTLGHAVELRASAPEHASFVTAEGDYMHPDGAVSGGTAQPGVLERKREIENLKSSVETLQKFIDAKTAEIEGLDSRIEGLDADIKSRQAELAGLDIKEAETRKDIHNFKNNLEKLEKRIEIINRILAETSMETDKKIALMEETRQKIEKLDAEKAVLEQRFGDVEARIKSAEDEERAIEREIADKKVSCASLMQKETGIIEDIAELGKRVQGIDRRLELESQGIEEKKLEKLRFIDRDKSTVDEIEEIKKALSESEGRLGKMRDDRAAILAELRTAEEKRETVNARLSELRIKNNSIELDLNSLQIEIENISEAMRRSSFAATGSEETPAVPEDTEEEEINLSAEEPRLRRLQAQIEKFGPVNLLAPEEYSKLEERYQFLNEQMDDLLQAITSLGKAISKIDKESEKRFSETFEIMNTKFQEIFSRLFKGGEGKLVLTDPENLLESGVEVMVRPRGKKFQSITLLSGGEKALSAIALIIAACLIKPAPFLLFDEIDAPLDDRNTSYFLELVKEIDDYSQVILITHNKKTMQEVNSLIGITSNKTGTSTVVSVDLT